MIKICIWEIGVRTNLRYTDAFLDLFLLPTLQLFVLITATVMMDDWRDDMTTITRRVMLRPGQILQSKVWLRNREHSTKRPFIVTQTLLDIYLTGHKGIKTSNTLLHYFPQQFLNVLRGIRNLLTISLLTSISWRCQMSKGVFIPKF